MSDSEAKATYRRIKKSKKRDISDLGYSIRKKHFNTADEMQKLEAEPDMNALTMEEKLASLEMNSDDNAKNTSEKEVPPLNDIPRADSVHVLLKQALHAQDHALLLKCLSMKDEKVITKSVAFLTPSEVLKLLESFLPMIQLRGAVLSCALPWLKILLCQHASSIASQESSRLLLNSLYQAIESRTSTYKSALELSTYIDCLLGDFEDDDENEAPVTIFEDTDSDDEMESEDDNEGPGAVIDSTHDSGGSDSD